MFDVRIKRVTEHPLTTEPNTVYIVQNGGAGIMAPSAYLVFTGNDNSVICRTLKPDDIQSVLMATVAELNGMVKAVDGEFVEAVAATDYVAPDTITNFTAPQRPSVSPRVTPINNAVSWDLSKYQILRVYLNSDLNNLQLSGLTIDKIGMHYQVTVINYGGDISWGTDFLWPDSVPGSSSGEIGKFDTFNFMVESVDNVSPKLIAIGARLSIG